MKNLDSQTSIIDQIHAADKRHPLSALCQGVTKRSPLMGGSEMKSYGREFRPNRREKIVARADSDRLLPATICSAMPRRKL